MDQGKFAYRKNLENARKAILDSVGTKFEGPTAKQQVEIQSEGLMRPQSRPVVEETSMSKGIGLALMEAMGKQPEVPGAPKGFDAPGSSMRPQSRPEYKESSLMVRPNKRPEPIDARDILARTLQAEAGGEGYSGMMAVGSVIQNRARSGKYGDGIQGVIMKPGQFSAWNTATGYAGGQGGLDMDTIKVSKEAYKAADKILSGKYKDSTGGATHYYNPDVASPKWGPKDKKQWTTIGRHLFGKA